MIVESSPTMTDGFKYGNDKIMADIFFLGSVRDLQTCGLLRDFDGAKLGDLTCALARTS